MGREVARGLALLFMASAAGCAPTIYSQPSRVFADDVLRPIAAQQVEERIGQARALLALMNQTKEQVIAGQPLPAESRTVLHGVMALVELNPGDARGAEMLRAFADPRNRKPMAARKAAYQETLAWLDSRRVALQDELVRRLMEQTVTVENGFLVCVDGVQRHYRSADGGRFIRLPDKKGAC
jgi:hypothetical protein